MKDTMLSAAGLILAGVVITLFTVYQGFPGMILGVAIAVLATLALIRNESK